MTADPWPDHRLDELRRLGDPDLDGRLDDLRAIDRDAVEELFEDFVRSQLEVKPDRWPPAVLDWWRQEPTAPAWLDEQQLTRAVAIFETWLPEVLASYLLASLPTAYAGAKGARVLTRISALSAPKPLIRRVLETLLFTLRVNERAGLRTAGQGVELARKTRLFHALVRMMVADFQFDMRAPGNVGEPWDPEAGEPINQEDLLGTLWTFALTPLEILDRAGARLSPDDKDSVVHLWCVVGHHLGIGADASPSLLPMDHAAAAASWKRIQEHQFAQSADGQMLTRVLVGCCRELIPIPPFKGLPEAAMYDNLGEGLAGELGVSAGGFARHVVRLTGAFYRLSLRIPGGRVLRAPLRHLLKRFVLKWLRQERSATGRCVDLPAEQRRCLVPMYVRPKSRQEVASI